MLLTRKQTGRGIAMHVLIIEDRRPMAALIADELLRLGFSSFELASSEVDAITAAAMHSPDLLVIDDRISEGSGIRAATKICRDLAVPVIFIVGDPDKFAGQVQHAVLVEQPFG